MDYGFALDLSNCKFEQRAEGIVKVSGSKLIKKPYTVKLEGSTKVAYRTLVIGGTRNLLPFKISVIFKMRLMSKLQLISMISQDQNTRYYSTYGKDGVMGPLEPIKESAHELGIVMEIIASSQELPNIICAMQDLP